MNYSMVLFFIQVVIRLEGIMLIPPMLISLFNGERQSALGFLITIAIMIPFMIPWGLKRKRKEGIGNRDAIIIVGGSWIILSLFGALPFTISGGIPNYIDALFETISGFTTTGSSILGNVEVLGKGLLFWRSFTHWIGGMGVLVFLLAIIPLSGSSGGTSIHLLRAESPGPQVDKIRPKMLDSAKTLYEIYIALTLAEIIFLLFGGMNLFETVCTAMGTAGTGGFGVKNTSIAMYSPYIQWVVTIFMILFSLNFNIFVFALARQWKQVFTGEEIRYYLLLYGVSAVVIIMTLVSHHTLPLGEAVRASAFQCASVMSTTGYSTVDFNQWPGLAKTILVILTAIGACAGSTGGGIKLSRILLLFKAARNSLRRQLHPREVRPVRLENAVVEEETIHGVFIFLILWLLILVLGFLLVSIDGYSFETSFTAALTTISNVGPGLARVGPAGNFAFFSPFSKIVLSMLMLIGRLEIIPMIMLFSPSVWKRK